MGIMKSTVVFLATLLFVSATTLDPMRSTEFIELSQQAESQAVFATLATTLKDSDEDAGFASIMGILNELLDDAKAQAQSATLIYKRTMTRCQIAEHNFKSNAQYFSNRVDMTNVQIQRTSELNIFARSNEGFLKKFGDFVEGLRTREAAMAEEMEQDFSVRRAAAEAAVDRAEAAVKALTAFRDNNAAPAFVQVKLENVAESYLKVHSYKLSIPTGLVQTGTSASNTQRLLEWANELRTTFKASAVQVVAAAKSAMTTVRAIVKAAKAVVGHIAGMARQAAKMITSFAVQMEQIKKINVLMNQLVSKNQQLIVQNRKYCAVENANYQRARATMVRQIAVFQRLRAYFAGNYRQLTDYVKTKYH